MWQTEVKEWEGLSLAIYDTILAESDKRLKEVTEDSEKITNRVYNLISIVIIILGGIIAAIRQFFYCWLFYWRRSYISIFIK